LSIDCGDDRIRDRDGIFAKGLDKAVMAGGVSALRTPVRDTLGKLSMRRIRWELLDQIVR
jgi:hypothetical protein